MKELVKKCEGFKSNSNFEDYCVCMEKLSKLNSEYLEVIPKVNPELISALLHDWEITNEINLLKSVYTLSFSIRAVLGAYSNAKNINPYDYLLGCLPVKLSVLDSSSDQASLILDYVNGGNPSSNYSLTNIIKVDGVEYSEEEDKKFFETENHMMLWHGTAAEHILSIMKEGLKIQKPGIPQHGAVYGKGVYFSDNFNLANCYSADSQNQRYIMLCEVALGRLANMCSISNQGLDEMTQFDSVRAMCQSGPDWDSTVIRDGKFFN